MKKVLEVKKIVINENFMYDDELLIEAGEYEFVEEGIVGYPMILVNDEWLDLCDLEALDYVIKNHKK